MLVTRIELKLVHAEWGRLYGALSQSTNTEFVHKKKYCAEKSFSLV